MIMLPPVFRLVTFFVFAIPINLLAQAAVEYAARSAGSAILAKGSFAIAGCPVDSALLTCLNHSYPRATILVGSAVCVFALWLLGGARHKAH